MRGPGFRGGGVFPAFVAAAAAVFAGCSLGLDFGLEGLPCAEGDAGSACLEGFICRAGRCIDAADAGALTCDGSKPPASECDGITGQWKPVCAGRACAPGSFCEGGVCKQVADSAGKSCSVDGDCGGGLFCLVPAGSGGGLCTRKCSTEGESCSTHVSCRKMTAVDGSTPKLCLPDSLTACPSEAACSPFQLSCTALWGRAGAEIIAITGCAARTTGGAAVGAGCLDGTGHAKADLCANRLCITPGSGMSFCSTVCRNPEDCGVAGIAGACGPVRLDAQVLPNLCLAVPVPTMCTNCSAGAAICGPDANVCIQGANACSFRCANTLDCPPSHRCESFGAGGFFCRRCTDSTCDALAPCP